MSQQIFQSEILIQESLLKLQIMMIKLFYAHRMLKLNEQFSNLRENEKSLPYFLLLFLQIYI